MPDLTQVQGNPSSAIESNYRELMSIQDPDQLKARLLEIVTPFVGKSYSEQNFRKMKMILSRIEDLTDLYRYISNFMLSGAGMSVAESDVAAVAGILTEGRSYMTPKQARLMTLARSYGFHVTFKN